MGVVEPDEGGVLIRIKAVPGASRDAIAGVLGDRLKVRISAPPEGGKANRAIAALLGEALGVRAGAIEVVSGETSANKTLRAAGVDTRQACARLGIAGEGGAAG